MWRVKIIGNGFVSLLLYTVDTYCNFEYKLRKKSFTYRNWDTRVWDSKVPLYYVFFYHRLIYICFKIMTTEHFKYVLISNLVDTTFNFEYYQIGN